MHVDPSQPNAAAASDAQAKMTAAGVDPATITTIVGLILQYGPQVASALSSAISRLFHHRSA